MKKLVFRLLSVSFIFSTGYLRPISNTTSVVLSGGASVGAAAGTWALLKDKSPGVRTVGSALAFVGAAFLSDWFFRQYTPHGRYERAAKRILRIQRDDFLHKEFDGYKEFSRYARRLYLTNDWYLVAAKVHMDRLINDAIEAIGLLAAAEGELRNDVTFCTNCRALTLLANQLIDKAADLVDLLVSDADEYDRQFKRYQKNLELEQRERQHREEMQRETLDHWDDESRRERHHREDREQRERHHREVMGDSW